MKDKFEEIFQYKKEQFELIRHRAAWRSDR